MNRISSYMPSVSPLPVRACSPKPSAVAQTPTLLSDRADFGVTGPEPEIPRGETIPPRSSTKPEQEKPFDPCGPLFLEEEKLDKEETKLETFGSFLSSFRHYALRGVPKPNAFSPELRDLWNDKFQLSPHQFFTALFDTPKVDLGNGEICVEGGLDSPKRLGLVMDLVQPRRGTIGRMERDFEFPDDSPPEVHHSLFELNTSAQGQGIAKDLLANSMRLYDMAGIGSIHLTAGLDVGGYAWAKYGFLPPAGRATRDLFSRIGGRLANLDGVSETSRKVVQRLLQSEEPKALWTISDLDGVTAERQGQRLPLGKALLLGTHWKGVMHLDDPLARARFNNYISKSTAQNTEEK